MVGAHPLGAVGGVGLYIAAVGVFLPDTPLAGGFRAQDSDTAVSYTHLSKPPLPFLFLLPAGAGKAHGPCHAPVHLLEGIAPVSYTHLI